MRAGPFPELEQIEHIIAHAPSCLEVKKVCEVTTDAGSFPVHALMLGNPDRSVPGIGFFGGVHGLERIGTHVVLAFLASLVERVRWDDVLRQQLSGMRLVFMPLVNPGGMWHGTRSNPNGVDLMRNAPVQSTNRVAPLLGGQRISAHLPWYRGRRGSPMEVESRAVCELVENELLDRDFSLALDCHSGFGTRDRIWFPWAHTADPIPHLPEVHALKDLFDRSYANHDYLFEPQSRQYLAHGDVWDHLYSRSLERCGRIFLPLTLELGSWTWVRKRPLQMLSRLGMFNPLAAHRHQRVLRRHLVWMDFLTRAACFCQRWLPVASERLAHRRAAVDRWYRGAPV
jgi:hypothetical protein